MNRHIIEEIHTHSKVLSILLGTGISLCLLIIPKYTAHIVATPKVAQTSFMMLLKLCVSIFMLGGTEDGITRSVLWFALLTCLTALLTGLYLLIEYQTRPNIKDLAD